MLENYNLYAAHIICQIGKSWKDEQHVNILDFVQQLSTSKVFLCSISQKYQKFSQVEIKRPTILAIKPNETLRNAIFAVRCHCHQTFYCFLRRFRNKLWFVPNKFLQLSRMLASLPEWSNFQVLPSRVGSWDRNQFFYFLCNFWMGSIS